MSPGERAPGLRALIVLAWPVILSRSAQAVIGFSDALMTAPLGEEALAAATGGALNSFVLLIFPMGIAFIVQSYASQLSGRGDHEGVRRYGFYGLILAVLAGLVSAPLLPLIRPALAFGAFSPEVRDLIAAYLVVRLLSVLPAVGIEAIGNWYGGLGNTRIHMATSILVMVLNVVLNYLLIEGHFGAPALGVTGAALASTVSTLVGFLVMLVMFLAQFGVTHRVTGKLSLSRREFGRMMRFGVPNGTNWFLEFAAFLLFINVIVAELGTTTLAALMAVLQVNSIAFMPAFGLASAGAILCGQAIGSKHPDHVPHVVRRTAVVASAWMLSVGLLYLCLPEPVMRLFAPRDLPPGTTVAAIVAVGAPMLALSAAWQLFDALAMTLGEALRSAGDTAWCMWARLTLAWFLFLPAAWLSVIVFEGGATAAILSMVGYLAVLSVALGYRFRRGRWRTIELTEEVL